MYIDREMFRTQEISCLEYVAFILNGFSCAARLAAIHECTVCWFQCHYHNMINENEYVLYVYGYPNVICI